MTMSNYYFSGRITKITEDDITHGPTRETLDEVEVFLHAGELKRQGWIGVSNAYCSLKRIDRDDWVVELAKNLRLTPADFYVPGEDEPAQNWKEHYLRCYSKDELTVHPQIYDAMKRMAN
jgi:hypothetical protein